MKLAVALAVLPAAAAFVGPAAAPAETRLSESKSDLEALAKGLNPTIGFWDPLNVAGASGSLYGFNNEQTIAWYRQAEIKHGRVAMAAFVGYCVQANGGHWATKMTLGGPNLCGNHAASWVILAPRIEQKSDSVLSRRRGLAVRLPAGQWDALPAASKWQIILFVWFSVETRILWSRRWRSADATFSTHRSACSSSSTRASGRTT